eukprot:6476730-Amphidinium_carterae.2
MALHIHCADCFNEHHLAFPCLFSFCAVLIAAILVNVLQDNEDILAQVVGKKRSSWTTQTLKALRCSASCQHAIDSMAAMSDSQKRTFNSAKLAGDTEHRCTRLEKSIDRRITTLGKSGERQDAFTKLRSLTDREAIVLRNLPRLSRCSSNEDPKHHRRSQLPKAPCIVQHRLREIVTRPRDTMKITAFVTQIGLGSSQPDGPAAGAELCALASASNGPTHVQPVSIELGRVFTASTVKPHAHK